MKVKNFRINVVVKQGEEKSLMTVEDGFTIKNLKERLNLPEGYEIYYDGMLMPDCAIVEDGDCVEIKTDIEAVVDRLQKDFVGLVKLLNK